jgi:hypothetical protein
MLDGVGKPTPLFSFDSIIDTDIGLMNLVMKDYLDPKIFDIDFFKKPLAERIHDIYYREDVNPLYIFSTDENKYKELLDICYKEFMSSEYNSILKYSVTTEVMTVLDLFKSEQGITPFILYYNDAQLELLENQNNLKGITKVPFKGMTKKEINSYSQIYFKTIEEAKGFINVKDKSLYFSTCGLNIHKDTEDLMNENMIIKLLAHSNNRINLYSMYKYDIIGGI